MAKQTVKGFAYQVDYGYGDPVEYGIYRSATMGDDNYTLNCRLRGGGAGRQAVGAAGAGRVGALAASGESGPSAV